MLSPLLVNICIDIPLVRLVITDVIIASMFTGCLACANDAAFNALSNALGEMLNFIRIFYRFWLVKGTI